MTTQNTGGVTAGWADQSGLIDLQPAPSSPSELSTSDRSEIAELFSRYAIAYDKRRLDVIESCFTPDAEYGAQLGPETMAHFASRAATIEGIRSVMAEQGDEQRRHLIANVVLELSRPDTVTATAYAFVGVAASGGLALGAMAIYGAEVIHTDLGWRFRRMIIGMDGYPGAFLPADIVISATGLNVFLFGGVELSVDSVPADLSQSVAYKAMMLSGIPNFAFSIGYTNASWTLKVDLVCEHLTRILAHLDATGQDTFTPLTDGPMELRPLLDFQAGYVQRAISAFPRRATQEPWTVSMSYATDRRRLIDGPVEDPALCFGRREPRLTLRASETESPTSLRR